MQHVSFCVNWLFRPVIRRAGWVDEPSARKQHARPTVISGGFGLFCAVDIGLGIRHHEATSVGLSLSAVALMFIAGFLDDHTPIWARYRLLVQIVASFALVVGNGAVLQHLFIAKDFDLTVVPGDAIGLSMFWMVGVINAINMSDGSDGVSSGKDPMAADCKHWHHLLKSYKLPKRAVALTSHLISVALATVGLLLWYLAVPEYVACWLFLAALALYSLAVTKAWLIQEGTDSGQTLDTPTVARAK